MIANLKFHVATIAITGMMFLGTITASFTKMLGKHYDTKKDFACCKQDKLVLHHYYTVNIFFIEVADGYTEENTGKASAGGCDIRCND